MKSPMIANASYIAESDKGNYTDLQVLRSGAGFYVGTLYKSPDGYVEPGSRDSDYFATKEEAEAHLKAIVEDGAATRMNP